jgi:hypothetical protein
MVRSKLQDIKPVTRRMKSDEEVVPIHVEKESKKTTHTPVVSREVPFEPVEPKKSSRYALWYIAVACVIGFILSLSFLFERSIVTITPKTLPVVFDTTDTFTAEKDSTDSDAIVYTVMSLSGDESIKLPGTESKAQSTYAKGTVVLYNAYQPTPYKLVKSTRLVTPKGLVYRIDNAVTIPGYTKKDGVVISGSVAVTVTAAVAGEGSNIEPSVFTLPGLAGTPQATKIFASSKTAITGGVSGVVYTIPQDAANAALGTLREKLKTKLIAKAKVQIPDGYLFYDDATIFTTSDSVAVPVSKTSDVPIALSGTLTIYLLKESTLVNAIAEKSISQYANEEVTIPTLSKIKIVPSRALLPNSDTTFTFTFDGSASILWTIKTDEVKALLVGKKKSEFQSLISGVTGVDRAELVVKPFWARSFPKDVSHIDVVVK